MSKQKKWGVAKRVFSERTRKEHKMRDLAQVVREAFEQFMEEMDESDKADSTKRNHRQHIGRFIRWLEGDYKP